MRIVVLTTLLLYNCIQVFGQKGTDYTIYFKQILKAEEEISNGNYNDALKAYLIAFKNYNFVFASDAYNAFQIGLFIKSNEGVDSLFYLCSKSGISKTKLLKNKFIFKEYLSDTIKYNSLYLAGRKEYLKRIDQSLRNEMLGRYKYEQQNKSKPNYKEICYDNFKRILELAKKGRFPGKKSIGINDDLNNDFVFATLYHYPNSFKILKPFLDSALKHGEIQPLEMIYLYGMNQTRTSILYNDKKIDTLYFGPCYNLPFGKYSNDIDQVNEERKKVNIFSIEIQYKLEKLAKRDSLDFKFGY